MQVGTRPASGPRLWDVRFGGERIVYELALQEALVSVSGTTPSQARPLATPVALHMSDVNLFGTPVLPCPSADAHYSCHQRYFH